MNRNIVLTNLLILFVSVFVLTILRLHIYNIEEAFRTSSLFVFFLYTINLLIFGIYLLVAFKVLKLRKVYLKESFFEEHQIKDFRFIAIALLVIIPLRGMVEMLSDILVNNSNSEIIIINFFLKTIYNSPAFLFCSLLIFMIIDFLPKSSKIKSELDNII